MLLGSQFYSLHDKTQTEEGIAEAFAETKKAGYQTIQLSGTIYCAPEFFLNLSQKYDIPIHCTHSPLDRVLNDTDRLIEEHKIYGADTIGIGGFGEQYRTDLKTLRAFFKEMEEPIKKIKKAGLHFTYHNHHHEFAPFGDSDLFEYIFRETDWDFVPDVYWMTFAGKDPIAYLKRMKGRTQYIHLKDMADNPERSITTCGYGIIPMEPILEVAKDLGVKAAYVEQDNAPFMEGGCFRQMALAAAKMLPVVSKY